MYNPSKAGESKMKDQTNYDKIDSDEELARQVASDPDLQGIPEGWVRHAKLEFGFPSPLVASKIVGGTDYDRVDEDMELARQESVDPDLADIPRNWFENATIMRGIPAPPSAANKRSVTMRLDPAVVDYFKGEGRGWQTRMNAVLMAYVDGQGARRKAS